MTSVEYKWDNNVQNFSPEDYHYHEVRKRIANVCHGNMIKPGVYRGREANQIIRAMQKAIVEDFEAKYQNIHGVSCIIHCWIIIRLCYTI